MATQKELEARIAQLEAQLADKGISAPAPAPEPPDQDDMLLEEVYLPIYQHEVDKPDLAPIADAPEPPDLAPIADAPEPPDLAPVQIGTRRVLRAMKQPGKAKQAAKG